MLRMLLALLVAMVGVLLMGPRVLPVLRKMKFGQTIYELGPQAHKTKQGTPTMGGLMTTVMTVIAVLVCHPTGWHGFNDFVWPLLFVALGSMLVGFVDDYIKVVKKRSLGLTAKQKLAGQVLVGVAFSTYCYFHPQVGPAINIPFFNVDWNLGWFYIPLMTVLVMFMTNSANLQDGLDGLLSSVTVVGSGAWGLMALFMMPAAAALTMGQDNLLTVGVFAFALAGASIGFLRFNRYPAMVFMGDTGSMFIGGATVGIAMLTRQPFLLLLIAFTMVMSSVSVMMQVTYFKLTHGKRIFKMSPIHHHFELCGYTEKQIVAGYAVVTLVLSVIALLSLGVI